MTPKLTALDPDRVSLRPGLLEQRARLNRAYVFSLKDANLLQNHLLEAGLWGRSFNATPHAPAPRRDIPGAGVARMPGAATSWVIGCRPRRGWRRRGTPPPACAWTTS